MNIVLAMCGQLKTHERVYTTLETLSITVTIVVAMVGNLYFESSIKAATIENIKISITGSYY